MSETVNTLEMLRKETAKILNVETVDTHVGLGELGIDSLNVVELIVFCEQLYGSIDPEQLNITQFTTLEQLDAQLQQQTV
ncbi:MULTISPECIES: acyl carrier protein [Chromobacterium]|uniref:Acyl carrier protein n=1 Tax=Chromobacterium vaccinii TaxID=1108595 RepID=A0A1D9LME4_9NEIS|nr:MULTISPECIES: acyl carrier protein [Chromobacterium]AOZ52446.1 acyl carrier protein [Chromobacterium vaccinii]MBX9345666.1 acyl carrier protein [Chromobacterium vaccinii]MCD4498622.1 acyl carrier protein [Chromobacterium vaccinii]MCD4506711.1 acyl carrier protein [Chromobacterium piscinae]SUX56258.1 Phosphopantetheine attachment site [Chromobacterium vaccinii]